MKDKEANFSDPSDEMLWNDSLTSSNRQKFAYLYDPMQETIGINCSEINDQNWLRD